MIKRLKSFFFSIWSFLQKKLLYISLALFAVVALYLWNPIAKSESISDFGLNAFTELIGIIVTVLIVDRIIKRQNEVTLLPVKVSMYRDIQLLLSRLVSFWGDIYYLSVPEGEHLSVEQLFSEECFDKILMYLSLDKEPNVYPKTKWWNWIPVQGKDFRQRGEEILERYSTFLEPEIFRLIHLLVKDSYFISGMAKIEDLRNYDISNGVPRPHNLGAYYFIENEALGAVIELYRWCEKNYLILSNKGYKVYKVALGHPNQPKNPPPSMLTTQELDSQYEAFRAWQNRNK
jgi:hypothetical protein